MNPTESRKVVVRWRTRDEALVAELRVQLGLPTYTTLNGWTPGEILPEQWPLLESFARLGYLNFMEKEWTYDGRIYSWKRQ